MSREKYFRVKLGQEFRKNCYVFRNGEALESDTNDNIFEKPKHPYTRTLLEAMLRFDRQAQL